MVKGCLINALQRWKRDASSAATKLRLYKVFRRQSLRYSHNRLS